MLIAVAALAGLVIAPEKSLATLPLATQYIATMCSTIPASLFMARVGRRTGFTLGQMIGAIGGLLSAYAVYTGAFWLLVGGCILLGIHNAFWQYFRFAAADAAEPAFRSRAISYVLAGGVIAAFLGPQLAKWTIDLAAVAFSASYATVALLCVISAVLLQFTRIPTPAYNPLATGGRPIRKIMATPVFIVAAMSSVIGYGIMAMLMTSTPLAMAICGFAFNASATVIQWHVMGMFLPSFFTGHLIKKFGVTTIIACGAVLQSLAIALALAGVAFENFIGGLILLGLGWNFMFIGGTTLLTESYSDEERAKTQAAHDFLVFAVVAAAAFASGALHETLGWSAVNLIGAVPIAAVFVTVVWYRGRLAGSGAAPGTH